MPPTSPHYGHQFEAGSCISSLDLWRSCDGFDTQLGGETKHIGLDQTRHHLQVWVGAGDQRVGCKRDNKGTRLPRPSIATTGPAFACINLGGQVIRRHSLSVPELGSALYQRAR